MNSQYLGQWVGGSLTFKLAVAAARAVALAWRHSLSARFSLAVVSCAQAMAQGSFLGRVGRSRWPGPEVLEGSSVARRVAAAASLIRGAVRDWPRAGAGEWWRQLFAGSLTFNAVARLGIAFGKAFDASRFYRVACWLGGEGR